MLYIWRMYRHNVSWGFPHVWSFKNAIHLYRTRKAREEWLRDIKFIRK
jgi:hypothetical protein